MRWLAVAGMAFALVGRGSAQVPTSPALEALVKTSGYQANVARLFASLPPDVFVRCPALVSNGSRVLVLQPVTVAADGFPVAGLWKQSFPVSGCGNDTVINFFFVAGADEKLSSIVAVPGDSHAGIVLQRDAVRFAMVAAQPAAAGCAALHVRDTRFDGAEPPSRTAIGATGAPWHETWTIAGCGRLQQVGIAFTPDATGTTIVAHLAAAPR